MRIFSAEPAAVAVLAFVTTLHCVIAVLRQYRPRERASLAFVPSLLFVVAPWYLPAPLWLAAGVASHVAWFIGCEKLQPPARSGRSNGGFTPVRVIATRNETDEIRTFRFSRPRGFVFRPGQFVMVRVEAGGKPLVRCYSITSSPSEKRFLEISVRRQGLVSRQLHETLVTGDRVEIRGPGGTFTYPDGMRPIVLIAGGIGITPLLCMLRHAIESQPQRPVTLLLSVRTEADIPYRDELRMLASQHPRFRLAIALTAGTSDPRFLSGRIDGRVVEAVVSNFRASVHMLCGPLPMIDAMKASLESLDVPSSHIHFEKFETALRAAAAPAEQAWITLRESDRKVRISAGQTILDACESAGAPVPSMCRVGVCGTCRTRLLAGEVAGDFEGLDESDRASGFILPCVAQALGDCALDL